MRPVVAPVGTVVATDVEDTTLNVAGVPLNRTAVAPERLVPVTVTAVPARPAPGEKDEIVGAAGGGAPVTLKLDALVAVPPAVVTAIGPVVAPLGTVAVIVVEPLTVNDALVPLNLTD